MTFRDISTGKVIDYNGEFGLTKQAASFFDFKIKGDISISFKIDNNSYNRTVLGYYNPNQINSVANTRKKFELLDKGSSIAIGYLIISRVDDGKIELYFASGNTNWFNLMAQKITDFKYEGFESTMDLINNRKTAVEGIVFPLIDWYAKGNKASNTFIASNILSTGYPSTETNKGLQEFFPCFYIKSIFKEITKNTGVGFSGNVFEDRLFNYMISTPAGPEIEYPASQVYDSLVKVKRSTTQPFLIASTLVQFDQVTVINNQERYSSYRYIIPDTGTIKVTVNMYFSAAQAYKIQLRIGVFYFDIVPLTAGRTDLHYYGYRYISGQKGDTISIYVESDGTFPNYVITGDSNVEYVLEQNVPAVLTSDTLPGYISVPNVSPALLVPSIKAVDLIKFITFYFGCVCTYDEYANTISINIIDKITSQEDWSDYYVSHVVKFETGVAKNNYIATEAPEESDLKGYNEKSKVKFGGGNIQTDYNKVQDKELYTIPFAPANDLTQINGIYMPYINFYDIKEDDKITMAFTTVTNSAGNARFNGTNTFKVGDMVSIKSSIYTGVAIVSVSNAAYIEVHGLLYLYDTTGTIIKLDYSPVSGKNRLLLALPGYSLGEAGTETSYNYVSGSGLSTTVNSTTGCLAYYDKVPVGNKPIDNIRQSLAIDSVTPTNISISDTYYGYIKRAFNNPLIEAKMIIPQSVFVSFNFDRLIYLKTNDLTGLFFVASITNYKDSNTPTDVKLYML
jgi:hypothetical protein